MTTKRPGVGLGIWEAAFRTLLRAGDIDDRAAALTTFRDVCARAGERHGSMGLAARAAAETFSLAGHIVRARLGLRLTATGRDWPRPIRRERTPLIRRLAQDLRLGWRGIGSNRGNTAIAVATLALGIGLATAVFSILDSILWRPVPYQDADRLVQLAAFNTQRKFSFMGFYSPALIRAWRTQTDLFDRVEGFDTPSFVYTTPAGSEMVAGGVVTPGLMAMLGVAPAQGRLFGAGDGETGTTNVAIVSDDFWRARLDRDPNAVGRDLVLDGDRVRIVGIMPASFRFPNGDVQIWLPFEVVHPPAGKARTMSPLARLAPGVTRQAAGAEARARGARLSVSVGEGGETTAELYRFGTYVDAQTRQSLWVLAGAVGFLLLVVCTNVANLALARSIQQSRDLAVRAALGASRGDLMRETLVESSLVAVIGCAGGAGLALLFIQIARSALPEAMVSGALNLIHLDARALAFASGLGAVSALLFGLPAALVASGTSVARLLGAGSRSASSSVLSRRLRSGLVIVEVSVAIVLLVGAALMTRSFMKLMSADKGFDATNLISIRLGLPQNGYADATLRDRFMQDAADHLRSIPGITGVVAAGLPTDVRPIMLGPVEFAQRPGAVTQPMIVPMHGVSPDYFAALAQPLLKGRTFRPDDPAEAVIVSESFARKYWPDGQALGGQFRRQQQAWQTVIGIAGDIRPMAADQDGGHRLDLYYQAGKAPQAMIPSMPVSTIAEYRNMVVRAAHPAAAIGELPAAIHAIDPRVVVWRMALVDHLYADAIARPRVVFALMATFAVAGLVLAMAGIYGVLSYLVTQRVREIGIRLALGATRSDVARLVLRNGLVLVGAGLVVGLISAAALARVMRALLYEVGPSDPRSMAAVAVLLVVTGFAASWRPARRAMRIDPVMLLRDE